MCLAPEEDWAVAEKVRVLDRLVNSKPVAASRAEKRGVIDADDSLGTSA